MCHYEEQGTRDATLREAGREEEYDLRLSFSSGIDRLSLTHF